MTEGFALHEILLDDHGVPCDYRFLEVNPAFERLTGLSRDAVLGRTVREVLPGIEPRWVSTYGRVALTGEPARFEDHVDSLGREYEVRAFSPRHGQFAVLFTDVTERRRTEEKLAWLASFPELNPNPVVEVDLTAGTVSYANPAARIQFPELVDRGLLHPWLIGVDAIAGELRASATRSTWREVQVNEWWCRQTLCLAPAGRSLRVYGVRHHRPGARRAGPRGGPGRGGERAQPPGGGAGGAAGRGGDPRLTGGQRPLQPGLRGGLAWSAPDSLDRSTTTLPTGRGGSTAGDRSNPRSGRRRGRCSTARRSSAS